MDNELLVRLIRSRLDGAVSEDEFERIRRGLAVADQGGEGDEPDWGEIAGLLLASLDEIESRMAYLEDTLEELGCCRRSRRLASRRSIFRAGASRLSARGHDELEGAA